MVLDLCILSECVTIIYRYLHLNNIFKSILTHNYKITDERDKKLRDFIKDSKYVFLFVIILLFLNLFFSCIYKQTGVMRSVLVHM